VNTRADIKQEFINKIESLKKDKEEFISKLQNKKKELRDLEQAFLKQTCIHDKEKLSLNEKINAFESKKKEIMEFYNNEIEKINQESLGMRDDFEKEISEKDSIIGNLKSRIAELERENTGFLSNKSTMKTKVGNLENQLEENKKFISEVQIKFDNILNNHISKSNNEKDKIKDEYQLKLNQMEQRYEVLIQEMQEEYEKTMFDMRKENEDLEEELNSLSKQTQANMKASDPKIINEKINELLATQNNLRKELENVKVEKEKKIAEITSNFDRERELLNLKILDLELALKEYEQIGFNKNSGFSTNISNSKNSGLNLSNFNNNNKYEFEQEKKKRKNEREGMRKNVGDLNMKIEKLENKIESLSRENETLKLTYLEKNHSPIHHYRGSSINANNANNSYIKKNSRTNSNVGINNLENNITTNLNQNMSNTNNNNNNLNFLKKKNSFTLNMQMNMSSPIGKQEPNLFSDNSEIGEYNLCYDISSPQVNISPDKKEYFHINENKNIGKYANGNMSGNNFVGNRIKK